MVNSPKSSKLAMCIGAAFLSVFASCSNSGGSSVFEDDPSATVDGGGEPVAEEISIESIEDLQQAYEAIGGSCPTLSIRDSQEGRTSADCDSDTVLSVFDLPLGPELNVLALAALDRASSQLFDVDLGGSNVIYGKNWLINEGEASLRVKLQEFGGQEVNTSDLSVRDKLFAEVLAGLEGDSFSALMAQCSDSPVSADATSISFDTEGEEDLSGDTVFEVYCSLSITGVPDYVFDLIGTTRALDGRQTETWGNFRASWSYHPDSGLNLLIVLQNLE